MEKIRKVLCFVNIFLLFLGFKKKKNKVQLPVPKDPKVQANIRWVLEANKLKQTFLFSS